MLPALTVEDRLLLACARIEPDLTTLRDLAAQHPDWATFVRKVERCGLATAVYSTARRSADLPREIAQRLRTIHHRDAIYAVARRERLKAIVARLSAANVAAMV